MSYVMELRLEQTKARAQSAMIKIEPAIQKPGAGAVPAAW